MKVITETRRPHQIWYLHFHYWNRVKHGFFIWKL